MSRTLQRTRRTLIFLVVLLLIIGHVKRAAATQLSEQIVSADNSGTTETETPDEDDASGLTLLDGKIRLGFLAEAILSYVDIIDVSDRNSSDQWDLYLGTLELGLAVSFTPWMHAHVVGGVDDVAKKDEKPLPSFREAYLALDHSEFPLYFILGKRTQPFGVFEDPLISGPVTEDLYEVEEAGLTLGARLEGYGLDVSMTVYEGQNILQQLVDENIHEFREGRQKETGIDSYILRFSMKPLEDVFGFDLFFSSEPGDDRRNETIGGALSWRVHDLSLDAECMLATKRESGEDGQENLESAWFISASYQLSDPLEVAGRYEQLDNDRREAQDEVLKYRLVAGFNYAITEFATVSMEYRYNKFEKETESEAVDHYEEIQLQLALEF